MQNRSDSFAMAARGQAIGEVIAVAGVKGHRVALALGENAETVVLDFVNPAGPAGGFLAGRGRQRW
jgi:hypothetical protein